MITLGSTNKPEKTVPLHIEKKVDEQPTEDLTPAEDAPVDVVFLYFVNSEHMSPCIKHANSKGLNVEKVYKELYAEYKNPYDHPIIVVPWNSQYYYHPNSIHALWRSLEYPMFHDSKKLDAYLKRENSRNPNPYTVTRLTHYEQVLVHSSSDNLSNHFFFEEPIVGAVRLKPGETYKEVLESSDKTTYLEEDYVLVRKV